MWKSSFSPRVLTRNRKSLVLMGGSILLGALAGPTARAAVIVTDATGNGADTYIRGDIGTYSPGTDSTFYAGSTKPYKSYLRFDLGAVTATVTSAQLELETVSFSASSDSLLLYGLKDGAAGDGDPSAATNPGWK
jgi:hypothetical protein